MRYQRRKQCRLKKKEELSKQYNFEKVADFESLRKAFYKCRKGSNWKASVQRYGSNILRNSVLYSDTLKNGKDISKGFVEFDICERGKKRHIMSVHISERVCQKSLCDNSLVPLMEKTLIYDNGASQKGKGTEFAARRFKEALLAFYKKYHTNNGYIIMGDAHDYFGSLDHDYVEEIVRKNVLDKRAADLSTSFIKPFPRGLGLGSQTCQIEAVAYANAIDHYAVNIPDCEGYGRYMDDWYLIIKDKEKARKYLKCIAEKYKEIGIQMNSKKTQIIKISRGITWLQDRYFLIDTGKIIRKPSHKSITRNRKKLKKMLALYKDEKITKFELDYYYASWEGYIKHKKAYFAKESMNKLYKDSIGG